MHCKQRIQSYSNMFSKTYFPVLRPIPHLTRTLVADHAPGAPRRSSHPPPARSVTARSSSLSSARPGGSFERLDRPVLRPLPKTPYEYAEQRHAKLCLDASIEDIDRRAARGLDRLIHKACRIERKGDSMRKNNIKIRQQT